MKRIVLNFFCLFTLISINAQIIITTDTSEAVYTTPNKTNFDFSSFKGLQVKSIDEAFNRSFLEEKYKNYNPVIIPDYFLLGTLNAHFYRYDSNTVHKSSLELKKDQFDWYWKDEEQKAIYIAAYLQDTLKIPVSVHRRSNGSLILYSENLTSKINDYFDGSRSLKSELFKNDEEFYSYLLGCYFRSGKKEGEHTYTIRQCYLNSDTMFKLLRKVGCERITYIHHNKIPGGIDFTFEASVLIEKYFDTINAKIDSKMID